MLDDLRTKDAPYRCIGNNFQKLEEVALRNLQAFLLADQEGVRAAFHTARRNPPLAHQLQKLPSTATQIEHRRSLLKVLRVYSLPLLDQGLIAAKSFLKE